MRASVTLATNGRKHLDALPCVARLLAAAVEARYWNAANSSSSTVAFFGN
jgi:hypothetical protein